MAKEKVGLFYDEMVKDIEMQKKFQEKFQNLSAGFNDEKLEDDRVEEIFREKVLPLIREYGYDFSYSDLKAYAEELSVRALDDDELEAVAAGADLCVCVIIGAGVYGDWTAFCDVIGGMDKTGEFFCACFFGGGGGPV